jgi:hypothetical protein
MDRMNYADWKKLPSGWMWRREPDSVRVIGLKGTNKTNSSSLTLKMSSRTEEGSFGSTMTTSVSLGSTKTTLGLTGSANMTLGSTGPANATLGSARSTSGRLGVPQTTSALDGTLKTTPGSLERLQGTSRTLETAGGLLGRVKPTSEALGTTPNTVRRFGTTATTFGTTSGTSETTKATTQTIESTTRTFEMTARTAETIQRSSGSNNCTSGTSSMMFGSTCSAHSPIVNHIIMVCGFKDDSVMVECINQKEWKTLNDVVSIGINEPNTFHTVKADGASFKARPLEGDIRMLKGFLTYFKRMTDTEARLLDEDDVMDTFTARDFKRYCCTMDYHTDMAAAGSVSIPSIATLIADGVINFESALRPSTPVSTVVPLDPELEKEDADIELEMTLNDKSTTETLFVKSWEHMSDDTEEYEMVFEEEDATSGHLPCPLIEDCFNVEEEELELQTVVSIKIIRQWGARYDKMHGEFNVTQWGATKQKTPLSRIENGEQMFAVYNLRMLIAVFDSARVFDPGGNTMNNK